MKNIFAILRSLSAIPAAGDRSAQPDNASCPEEPKAAASAAFDNKTDLDISDFIVSGIEKNDDGTGSGDLPEKTDVNGMLGDTGSPTVTQTDERPMPTQVVIIGTAHVSERSVEQVRQAIREHRPDIVAVELCPRRYKGMTEPEPEKEMSVKDIISGGKMYYNILYMLLAHIQKKMGDEMGVPPGSEMIAAIEGAQESGAEIALVDRDIRITFRRFIAKMSLWEKIRFLFTLAGGALGFGGKELDDDVSIDTLTDQDVITVLIEEFRKFAPTVASVLIDERDAYLAGSILRTVQKAGPGKKVVAVIGAGHRKGVMEYLKDPATIPDPASLTYVPEKKFGLGKLIGGFFIAFVFFLFGYILYSIATQPDMTMETFFLAFGAWFFINGALSALGVAAARGHYTSAIVSFCVAWMTSLNPLLAAGWFAGLAEARVRHPTTKDFANVVNAETFSEIMSNNFFRVLLVAALSNIGSMIGTFIGAYVVLKISGIDIAQMLTDIVGTALAAF